MKKTFSMIALATLTVGLLGSCAKINERLDDLEKKVDGLENEEIATIKSQVSSIESSISDLKSIRDKVQAMSDPATGLDKRIKELEAFASDVKKNYATKDWAKTTLVTMEEYEKTCDTVAKIAAKVEGFDSSLKACADSLKGWVNEKFGGYYDIATIDAKLAELQEQVDGVDSLSAELAKTRAEIDTAKAAIREGYRAAIASAIENSEGKLTKALQDSIDNVNATISTLTGRVDILETAVAALTGKVDSLENMIQAVTIVPAYSDGSVGVRNDSLFIDCIVSPCSAVKALDSSNFTILLNTVETRASGLKEIAITEGNLFSKDTVAGTVSIRADISDFNHEGPGKTLAVAVKVKNDLSNYTTKFVGIAEDFTYDAIYSELTEAYANVYRYFQEPESFPALHALTRGNVAKARISPFKLAAATDEAVSFSPDDPVNDLTNGNWSAVNPCCDTWSRAYAAIEEIRKVLENTEKLDPDEWKSPNQKNSYQSELRFLRAFFYFELFKTYGAVPLVTTANDEMPERAPVEEVVKFIVNELDEILALQALPFAYTNAGDRAVTLTDGSKITRVTECAVRALKVRTLLYAASPLSNLTNDKAKYEKAAQAAMDLFNKNANEGEVVKFSNYSSLWGGEEAFNNPELIFGILYSESNAFEKANYPSGIAGSNASGICPSQSLIDHYEFQDNGETFGVRYQGVIDLNINPYEGLDPRFALSVVRNGDSWPDNYVQRRSIETFIGGLDGATPTGYYLRKGVGNCITAPGKESKSRHTLTIFRLSEIYLDFAEAAFYFTESANDATFGQTASDAVDKLRLRSDINMPKFTEDGEAWVERYERERLVEFAFENHRFWDVRRWKKAEKYFIKVDAAGISWENVLTRKTIDRKWEDKYYLFPIPTEELDRNPKLTQNPGW